jgi:hypothetical protein
MTKPRDTDTGLWTDFSDARGIDLQYERVKAKAEKELDATLAGPSKISVPADDTELKNPDGEFADPAAMVEPPAERAMKGWDSRGDHMHDPEGQQGGTEGGRPAIPPLPNEVHPVRNTK